MALGDIVNAEVKEIIIDIWRSRLENGWTAKEIQAEVAKRVQEIWPEKYKPDWPGLRAVQNKIAEIKDAYKNYEKLYKPWNIGMLDVYPVPSEALSIILSVQQWAETYEEVREEWLKQKKLPLKSKYDEFWLEWNHFDISIRQVYWIARLYALINWDKARKNKTAHQKAVRWLWTWSKAYMYRELRCWLTGINPPDTSELDKALRDGWTADIIGHTYRLIPRDKNTLGIMGTLSDHGYRDESVLDIIKREKDGEK